MSSVDRVSIALGYEDNRLKALNTNKCIKLILLISVCSLVFYIPLRITASRSGGQISALKRGGSQSSVQLELYLNYEGEELVLNPEITLLAEGQEKKNFYTELEQKSFLEAFADKLIYQLSNDSKGSELVLPSESDGVLLVWNEPKADDPIWVFAIALLIITGLWFSKDDGLKLRKKSERAQLSGELPNMILQMVLLLNAGLIADAAFDQLIANNEADDNYLYRVMRVLKKDAEESNTIFVSALYTFAKDYDDRNLLRFATLCVEHSNRGSELASKLEQERNQQWNGRLNRAKAKAKEAETKLCFPLMLLLSALVIICIAPAMFQM